MKAGDGAIRSTDLPDAFLNRQGTHSSFRPSAAVRVRCLIRPYQKRCIKRRRGPQFSDRQLIGRINGTKI